MKILMTGACGFVGRALIKELESEHELRLTDSQDPKTATVFVPGSEKRAAAPLDTKWPFFRASITDAEAMRKMVQGMDAVVHLAASPTGDPAVGIETFSTNAVGTYTLLDVCIRANVPRFLTASSVNAFGTIYWRLSGKSVVYPSLPLTEAFPPVPEDPYSLSKVVNEETCAAFHRAYGITTAALRFGGVWTDEIYNNVLDKGLEPTAQWSDDLWTWVHLADIAAGIRQAAEAPGLPGSGVYTLNAADTRCPEPTLDLIRRFKPEMERNLTAPLPGRATLLSIDAARSAFGYSPRYRLGA